jgi:hypothetical protein
VHCPSEELLRLGALVAIKAYDSTFHSIQEFFAKIIGVLLLVFCFVVFLGNIGHLCRKLNLALTPRLFFYCIGWYIVYCVCHAAD